MSLANDLGKAADAASQIHEALQGYTPGIALLKADVEQIADPELRQKLLTTIEELSHATNEVTNNVSALANSLAEMDEVVSGPKAVTISPPPDDQEPESETIAKPPVSSPPPNDNDQGEVNPCDVVTAEAPPVEPTEPVPPSAVIDKPAQPDTSSDKLADATAADPDPAKSPQAEPTPELPPVTDKPSDTTNDKPESTATTDKANNGAEKPPTQPPPAA